MEETGFLLADGFEDCFIGFGRQFTTPVAVYDYDKCVAKIVEDAEESCREFYANHEGCNHYDEAVEYMEFNVVGAWVGKSTPVFIRVGALDALREEMLDFI